MRSKEGASLKVDLAGHLDAMMRLLGSVSEAQDSINERLEAKLQGRLERLLGERVDPFRLAQEAAILADKADVSEEIAASVATASSSARRWIWRPRSVGDSSFCCRR